MTHHPLKKLFVGAAGLVVAGLAVTAFSRRTAEGSSESSVRPGRLAQWSQARKIRQAEERARRAFKSHGTVVSARNQAEKGDLFAVSMGHTELDTTHGLLIIDDLVGPVSKGLAVYVNQVGQVRIGGLYSRTFALRRENAAASVAG